MMSVVRFPSAPYKQAVKSLRSASCLPILALSIASSLLVGCSANFGSVQPSTSKTSLAGLKGNVHGGQQPLANAYVYVYAASTAGYGAESLPLFTEPAITDGDGSFTITGAYSCTAGQQVYIYVSGGESSGRLTDENAGSGLLAVLGTCPGDGNFLAAVPYIAVNEVSTVAAAYALAPFAIDPLHVGSPNTPLALQGISQAFSNAELFYDISGNSGQGALSHVPTENIHGSVATYAYVPSATVNTLANILAYCVNSVDTGTGTDDFSIPCTNLFYTAPSADNTDTGLTPPNTAAAAINIAHYPGADVHDLYDLAGSTGPFQPSLSDEPLDFALYVFYTNDNGFVPSNNIAIDTTGKAWFIDSGDDPTNGATLTTINPLIGIVDFDAISTGTSLVSPTDIAIDPADTVWISNYLTGLVAYSPDNGITSPTGGYACKDTLYDETIGGGDTVAVDSSGNIWQSLASNFVCKFNSSGGQQAENGEPNQYDSNGYPALAADAHAGMWEIASAINTEPGAYVQQLTSSDTNGPIQAAISGETNYYGHIALDHTGDIWVTNPVGPSIMGFNSSGDSISGTDGFTNENLTAPVGIAIDGLGHIWATDGMGSNTGDDTWPGGSLFEFAQDGTVLSSTGGYSGGTVIQPDGGALLGGMNNPSGIAIDGAGDIWIGDPGDHNYEEQTSGVYEFIGIAAPVVTPLAAAVAADTIGTRP